MAETMDTKVLAETTLSSSEVSQYLHPDVQNEAALAVMAAKYDVGKDFWTPNSGEFARYFEIIRDGGEAKWTTKTLADAQALKPAIDHYTKVLPCDLLLLPLFFETKESANFGPLPPVTDLDLHKFQRALYRLHSLYEVTRQSNAPKIFILIHYEEDRKKIAPYSYAELNQAEILNEILSYRMFQACEKHLDSRYKRVSDTETRKTLYNNHIQGIVSHGLQFMYEIEMQTTYQGRENLIQKVNGNYYWSPMALGLLPSGLERSAELCIMRRILGKRLHDGQHGCVAEEGCQECPLYEEWYQGWASRNKALSSSDPASTYPEETADAAR